MKRGFTLIELLVVIAIIGLLSSIVFASISAARDKANVTKAKVQAKEIGKAIELSRLSNNSLPVQMDTATPIKTSPVETAISEFYSGDIPSIPDSVGGENNEYYYITDGNKSFDEYGNGYRCGYNGGDNTPDDYVIFYKQYEVDTSEAYGPGDSFEEWTLNLAEKKFDDLLFFAGINPNSTTPVTPDFADNISIFEKYSPTYPLSRVAIAPSHGVSSGGGLLGDPQVYPYFFKCISF